MHAVVYLCFNVLQCNSANYDPSVTFLIMCINELYITYNDALHIPLKLKQKTQKKG